jgi:hypothetical protein
LVTSEYGDYERAETVINDIVPSLTAESPVFVFEKKGPDYRQGLKTREEVLQKSGLVKKDILVRPTSEDAAVNDNLVWRARISKEKSKGEPINYFEGGPSWRKSWLENLIKEEKSKYQQAGFTVVSIDEIVSRLKNTTFPLDDLGKLKLGFGFRLRAPCGCEWRVTHKGDWVRDLDCGDAKCDGIPER